MCTTLQSRPPPYVWAVVSSSVSLWPLDDASVLVNMQDHDAGPLFMTPTPRDIDIDIDEFLKHERQRALSNLSSPAALELGGKLRRLARQAEVSKRRVKLVSCFATANVGPKVKRPRNVARDGEADMVPQATGTALAPSSTGTGGSLLDCASM